MKYSDVYKDCQGCPVEKYCGTMIGSIRLCNSYKPEEDKNKMDKITIKGHCPMCGNEWSVEVNEKAYQSYKEGDMLIQDALPELSPAERELLITGFCDDCWQKFAEYEEELENESLERELSRKIDIDEDMPGHWEKLPE